MTLSSLPTDVLGRILLLISHDDICSLAKTCRSLRGGVHADYCHWREVIRGQFGEEKIPSDLSRCRDVVEQLLCSRKYGASPREVNGPWRDSREHWQVRRESNSDRQAVLHLNRVCWLDIGADFVVRNGVYLAFARLRAETEWMILNVHFQASVPSTSALTGDINPTLQSFARAPINTWHLVQIPTPIVVIGPQGRDTVRLSLVSKNDVWKGGLDIDYFELRPAPHDVQDEYQAWLLQAMRHKADGDPTPLPLPHVLDKDTVTVLPDPPRYHATNKRHLNDSPDTFSDNTGWCILA
ncbi:hypothetical protein RI367_006147 [Sorochytrium milnesiophthora]